MLGYEKRSCKTIDTQIQQKKVNIFNYMSKRTSSVDVSTSNLRAELWEKRIFCGPAVLMRTEAFSGQTNSYAQRAGLYEFLCKVMKTAMHPKADQKCCHKHLL